jgi:hypothetical protein
MVSSFYYFSFFFVSRVSAQRSSFPLSTILKVSLVVAVRDNRNLEDVKILNSFRHLEAISGRKPSLAHFGSKYVGTVKRTFFLVRVDLRDKAAYSFIERVAVLLLPNLQKRLGRSTLRTSSTKIQIHCRDLQLFSNYSVLLSHDPVTISVFFLQQFGRALIDALCLYKFNFL